MFSSCFDLAIQPICESSTPLCWCSTPEQARAVANGALPWSSGAEVPFLLYHPAQQQHHTADEALHGSSQHITDATANRTLDFKLDTSQDPGRVLEVKQVESPVSGQHSNRYAGSGIQQAVRQDVEEQVQQQSHGVCMTAMHQQLIAPVTLLCLEGQYLAGADALSAGATHSGAMREEHVQGLGSDAAKIVPSTAAAAPAGAMQEGHQEGHAQGLGSDAAKVETSTAASAVAGLAATLQHQDVPGTGNAAAQVAAGHKAASAAPGSVGEAQREDAPGTGSGDTQQTAEEDTVDKSSMVGAPLHGVTVLLWVHPAAVKTAWQVLKAAAEARGVACRSR